MAVMFFQGKHLSKEINKKILHRKQYLLLLFHQGRFVIAAAKSGSHGAGPANTAGGPERGP